MSLLLAFAVLSRSPAALTHLAQNELHEQRDEGELEKGQVDWPTSFGQPVQIVRDVQANDDELD